MNAIDSDSQPDKQTGERSLFLVSLVRIVVLLAFEGALLFVAVGRLDWIWGWAFLGTYGLMSVVSLLIVPLTDELIEERTQVKADVKGWDKVLSAFMTVFFLAMLVVAGLDVRGGWSPPLPAWAQIAALVLLALGHLLIAWATRVNQFFARFVRIQKERGHTVVTDGPYRVVRHPGYVGTIISFLATPVALGALWTYAVSGLMALVVVIRTALEDRTLIEELPGYAEYTQKTRYRLLPGIW
jgi:protein-S-isoprenylcysteine O-methyltransferase Ste14